MLPFLQADNRYMFKMLCYLFEPSVEKSQKQIIFIHGLGCKKKLHTFSVSRQLCAHSNAGGNTSLSSPFAPVRRASPAFLPTSRLEAIIAPASRATPTSVETTAQPAASASTIVAPKPS